MRGPRLRWLRLLVAFAVAVLAAAPAAVSAPPQVPATLSYQGVLLEPGGQPRSGVVDLTIRVFDDLAAGTLIYTQRFPAVPLVDGAFHVVLGPDGVADDAPVGTPLTTSLADALAGDVGPTGSDRFLEVTVGSEGALGRTQVLATAYALRAAHAASADSAALVNVANTALDAQQVGGLPSAYLTELWEHLNADGGGPGNTDPLEGLGDVDGDGIANFVDADNDGDEVSDAAEVANGTSVNVITPTVLSLSPPRGFSQTVTAVTVNGTGFQPGLTAQLGSQALAPSNVTWTSFSLDVGPQAVDDVDLTVTLPNAEADTAAGAFQFVLDTLFHTVSLASHTAAMQARPGTQELALAGAQGYGVGQTLAQAHPLATNGSAGQIAVAWDGDVLVGARCRHLSATSCAFELLRDADGDRELEDETGTLVETIDSTLVTPMAGAVDLLYDASGRAVLAYVRRGAPSNAMLARDLDDDGDFDGAGERTTVESNVGLGAVAHPAALALDSAGRIAYAYHAAGVGLRIKWDRNGDGDFADTVGGNPETLAIAVPSGNVGCLGAAFDAGDRLAVVFGEPFQVRARLLRDLSADGDFADTGEDVQVPSATGNACDVAARPGQPLAVATVDTSTDVELRIDEDGDGVFDSTRNFAYTTASPAVAVAVTDLGTVLVAAQGRLHFAP